MKVLFKWYEPIKYGRRLSRTPLFDRLFPFVTSALVSCLFFGAADLGVGREQSGPQARRGDGHDSDQPHHGDRQAG